MSLLAWIACLAWISVTLAVAATNARRGLRADRGHLVTARLKSPTIYLFAAYLLIASWVTPRSPGESTSPLFWLAFTLPLTYALATLSSIGNARRSPMAAIALALLHG